MTKNLHHSAFFLLPSDDWGGGMARLREQEQQFTSATAWRHRAWLFLLFAVAGWGAFLYAAMTKP